MTAEEVLLTAHSLTYPDDGFRFLHVKQVGESRFYNCVYTNEYAERTEGLLTFQEMVAKLEELDLL
jgi:hypothetical protein